MKKTKNSGLFISNKKAEFDYDIRETLEAGIVLTGAETKAVRDKKVDFSGSFVKPVGGEMFVINLHIGVDEGDTRRTRKLLLNKNEILSLNSKIKQQKLTLIPLSLYTMGRRIKLELGLAKGKKAFEKRASIKKADISREMEQELKNG
jgi:SsrA-binding protein